MIKQLFLTTIFFCFLINVKAQIKVTATIIKPAVGVVAADGWVTIYQKKNYQGLSKTYTANNATTSDLGFVPDTVSIKIKPGYIAYISVNCSEFSNEVAIYENIAQFIVSQKQICGIRIEKAKDYWVKFDGMLSEIHNNDCKRFYGNIKYKIFELNERNERIYYNIGTAGSVEVVAYNKPKTNAAEERALFNINDYYVADRDYINGVVFDPSRYKPYITRSGTLFPKKNFKISEAAFRNKKVFIEIVSKIGSYHKGCDLCTDFTKDAEMALADTKVFNTNSN